MSSPAGNLLLRERSPLLPGRSARGLLASGLCGLTLALGACGGDDAPARSIRLDAAPDGSLRFQRAAATTAPGRVSLEMANPAAIPHAIGVRGKGVDEVGDTVGQGETSRVEADLAPGSYEVFCPVGAHEQAGMVARLTIR